MILQLDVGNSSIKWRLLDSNYAIAQRGSLAVTSIEQLSELILLPEKPQIIDIASVASQTVTETLAAKLEAQWHVKPNVAVSQQTCAGVINGYKNPSQLGVDRWLALLAAYREFQQACIVFDFGSAITVDGVDAAGRHIGGYIVPGISLQKRAILNNTDGVQFDLEEKLLKLTPGQRTAEAVNHGIIFAAVSFFNNATKYYQRLLGGDVIVVLTGGDADLVQKFVDGTIIYRQDLILDGLGVARQCKNG